MDVIVTGHIDYKLNNENENLTWLIDSDNQELLVIIRKKGPLKTTEEFIDALKISAGCKVELEGRHDNYGDGIPAFFCTTIKEC